MWRHSIRIECTTFSHILLCLNYPKYFLSNNSFSHSLLLPCILESNNIKTTTTPYSHTANPKHYTNRTSPPRHSSQSSPPRPPPWARHAYSRWHRSWILRIMERVVGWGRCIGQDRTVLNFVICCVVEMTQWMMNIMEWDCSFRSITKVKIDDKEMHSNLMQVMSNKCICNCMHKTCINHQYNNLQQTNNSTTHRIRHPLIQTIQNSRSTHHIPHLTPIPPAMIQHRIQLDLPSTARRIPQPLLQPVHPARQHPAQIRNTRIGKHGGDYAPSFLIVVEIIGGLGGLDAVGGGYGGEVYVGGEAGEGGAGFDVGGCGGVFAAEVAVAAAVAHYCGGSCRCSRW